MSIKRSISDLLKRSGDTQLYQCSNCRYRFEASEDDDEECPSCHSDEITAL